MRRFLGARSARSFSAAADAAAATPAPAAAPTWTSLGLPSFLLGKLAKSGIGAPTPIQVAAVAPLVADLTRPPRDALIHAETGTGKTLAYLLPALARLAPRAVPAARLRAVVVVPTRELAHQVAAVAEALGGVGRNKDPQRALRVLKVVGEVSAQTLHELREAPPQLLVGTPHTLAKLLPAHVNTGELEVLVLDEADELLRVHNVAATRALVGLARAHKGRPGIFAVSATSSFGLEKFARESLRAPPALLVADLTGGAMATPATLRHALVRVPRADAVFNTFTRLLAALRPAATLCFHNSAASLEALEVHLRAKGVRVGVLGAAYSNAAKARALDALACGRAAVLLSTEMAARGLDLPRLTHVVNFDPAASLREYVHRAGRVGRLSSTAPGRAGVVVSFAGSDAEADTLVDMATELGVGLDELSFEAGLPITAPLVAPAADMAAHRAALARSSRTIRLKSLAAV